MAYFTLSDHNSDRQVIALGHNILERILATLQVGDLVRSQLLLPLLLSIRVFLAVILWVNDASGLIVREVRDDVAPSLVIVDAQSDDEALARVGQEAKGARSPAPAHLEHMVTVDLVPGSTIGVFPNRLLDDTEVRVLAGISLVDKHLNRITHFFFEKKRVSVESEHGDSESGVISCQPRRDEAQEPAHLCMTLE